MYTSGASSPSSIHMEALVPGGPPAGAVADEEGCVPQVLEIEDVDA